MKQSRVEWQIDLGGTKMTQIIKQSWHEIHGMAVVIHVLLVAGEVLHKAHII